MKKELVFKNKCPKCGSISYEISKVGEFPEYPEFTGFCGICGFSDGW